MDMTMAIWRRMDDRFHDELTVAPFVKDECPQNVSSLPKKSKMGLTPYLGQGFIMHLEAKE